MSNLFYFTKKNYQCGLETAVKLKFFADKLTCATPFSFETVKSAFPIKNRKLYQ